LKTKIGILRVLLVDEDVDAAAAFRTALDRAYGQRAALVHFVRCVDARNALTRDDASGVDIAFIGCRDDDSALRLVGAVRASHPLLPLVILIDMPKGRGAQRAIDDVNIAALRAGADDALDRASLDPATIARVARYALERARSNSRLLESERRYRLLFDAHPLPLWLYDPETLAFVDVNPAAIDKYGYSREQFLSMSLRDIRDPAEVPRLEAALASQVVVRAHGPWRHRTATGQEMLVDTFGQPVELDGRRLRIVTPIDRTGEYGAAEALRQANQALERRVAERTAQFAASERRYRVLTDLAPQVVWSADAKGDLTYINRAWYAMVGGEPADWLGHGWLGALHPDDVEPSREAFFAARRNVAPMRGKRRIRALDGSYRTTLFHAAPILDESGRIEQWIGVDTDITEIERGREQVEQANADLEVFSYTVSHDLRAPLHVIQGFAEALLNNEVGTVDEVASDYLRRITTNAHRMEQLIQDILRLSRVLREALDLSDFDIAQLARQTMAELREQAPGRQIEFDAPGCFVVRADRRLVEVVLHNLLDNALKFTSREPVAKIGFGVHTCVDGRQAFEVRDNGVGFPVAWRDPTFGVFQRLHSAAEFPGTGIGLATVARIVRRHGGRIEAEGEHGKGAVFRFTLGEQPRVD